MAHKTHVAIIIGGQSTEHQVSLISGSSVLSHLDSELYEASLYGITTSGLWYQLPTEGFLNNGDDISKVSLNLKEAHLINISFEKRGFVKADDSTNIQCPDVIFPVLHGSNGEDGSIQGLFQLLGIPVAGCGVLGSAVCMDKDVTKRLLDRAGIKNAKYVTLRIGDSFGPEEIVENLGLPVFVKSANGGSSVGVNKVNSIEGLVPAIEDSFKYDNKVIIEEMISGRELECSVLGNESPEASTVLGEIIPNKEEYYSYDAKYINDDGVKLAAPADVKPDILSEIRSISLAAYSALDCSGLARIDFFLTEQGVIYVNEINTMPGFTSISMYPKLFTLSGIPYSDLITKIINLAFERSSNGSKS